MVQLSPWEIRGYKAHVHLPTWQATIDLIHPQLGLTDLQVRGVLVTHCQLLQVITPGNTGELDFDETLEEAYERLDDLVVTYGESDVRPVRPQVYWSVLRGRPWLGGIELVVSVQTPLLDSQPATWVSTRWKQGESWRLLDPQFELFEPMVVDHEQTIHLTRSEGLGLFVVRPKNATFSIGLGVFPADFSRVRLGPSAERVGHELGFELFPDSLEKGVIRRSRVRCWLLPRDEDMTLACAAYQDFCGSPLPLTT
jgi:hypothetical protein